MRCIEWIRHDTRSSAFKVVIHFGKRRMESGNETIGESILFAIGGSNSRRFIYVFHFCQMMVSNLRGELTTDKPMKLEEFDLIDAVARSLQISSPKELSQLGETLFPAMVNTSVLLGDLNKVDMLKSHGANLSAVNYDHRTALHVSCCEGNEKVVKHLLAYGVSVHIRDRHDRTALMEAISCDNHEIIQILMKCGAHMTGSARDVGDQLCSIAARGGLKRLESYRLAGADLSLADTSERTALHLACLHGHEETVKYLLKHSVDTDGADMLGLAPYDYAQKGGHSAIIKVLEASGVKSTSNGH